MGVVRRLLLGGGQLDFVALRRTNNGGGATVAFTFSAPEEGALAIVLVQSTTTTPVISISAGGWTTVDPGDYDLGGGTLYQRRIFWKVLAAGDTASGLTIGAVADTGTGDGGAVAYIVRGPTSIAVKSNANSSGGATTLVIPSSTPAANTRGAVAFLVDLDAAATFSPPTAPASSTRLAATIAGGFTYGVYDWSRSDYTGQSLTFTGFSGANNQSGALIEMLA